MLSFELEKLDAAIPVYNIEVDDFHTYFVGDGNGWVLVHNRYIGENGPEIDSITVWQNGPTERLDLENPLGRDGQIHYHDEKNYKYMYDIDGGFFYDKKPEILAPRSVQKLLKDSKFSKAIEKALKFLGEK